MIEISTDIENYQYMKDFSIDEIKVIRPIKIGHQPFAYSGLREITFSDEQSSIPSGTFYHADFLDNFKYPQNTKQVDSFTFAYCVLNLLDLNKAEKICNNAIMESTIFSLIIPNTISYISPDFALQSKIFKIIINFSKEDFLKNVVGAKEFYDKYKNVISFKYKSLDEVIVESNSITSIIKDLDINR